MAEVRTSEVEKWLGHIQTYDRAFSKWEKRVTKILKRYREERGESQTRQARFNILWSNVQTLSAATFAKLPKPDVSRRFRDNDPVGRVASLILERALDYEIQHYSDYKAMLRSSVLDRFLGARATCWVRYEPHFMAAQQGEPAEGLEVTEDVEVPDEVIEYECAPVDYVHWRDFGHVIARTWEEVPAVWRKVYMAREALVSRFGEEIGNKIPLDAKPEEFKDLAEMSRALIYEIWDKESKTAKWLSKSLGEMVDERKDPLQLEEFFPCPRPLYGTLTNESLEPTPDFLIYQDQAVALDALAEKEASLIDQLQIRGVHDAAVPSLARIFTEASNGDLIPVKNWAAFSEKGGLKNAIDVVDLKNIVVALQETYQAAADIKQQVYELTGISDIVRGQGDADATATAEQLKGQFASLRLKAYQDEVGEYAQAVIQIKAQIICNKFSPETIARMSGAEQLSDHDKQYIEPALELLLGPRAKDPRAPIQNPMRSFRVEIAADSLVMLDERLEREARMQFLQSQAQFMKEMVAPLVQTGPNPISAALSPLMMEMWKYSVTSFKVGKVIEGAFDEASEKLKQILSQPPAPPQPTPADQANMAKAQASIEQTQTERQVAPIKAQAEMTKAQAGVMEANIDMQEAQIRAANPAAFQAPQSRQ